MRVHLFEGLLDPGLVQLGDVGPGVPLGTGCVHVWKWGEGRSVKVSIGKYVGVCSVARVGVY